MLGAKYMWLRAELNMFRVGKYFSMIGPFVAFSY